MDLGLIRDLARLNDDAFRLNLACYLCDLMGGLTPLPTKKHKVILAKELLKKGIKKTSYRAYSICIYYAINKN